MDYGPQVGMISPYGQAFQIGHVPAGMFDAMGGYYGGGGSGGPSAGNNSQLWYEFEVGMYWFEMKGYI